MTEAAAEPTAQTVGEPQPRRSGWIWVSAVLALVALGAVVWALTLRSDRDDTRDELATASQQLSTTQQELDRAKSELAATKQELAASEQRVEELEAATTSERRQRVGRALAGATGVAAAKRVYDDLVDELGATQQDLAATQEDVAEANAAADDAADEVEAAEREAAQADTATDRAEAKTAQAQAEAEQATAKSTVVADCARGYVSALGALFEGDSVRDQAADVRKRLAALTDDCKDAL